MTTSTDCARIQPPQDDFMVATIEEDAAERFFSASHVLFDMRVAVVMGELRNTPNLPPAGSRCERFPEHLWVHGSVVLNKAVERLRGESRLHIIKFR